MASVSRVAMWLTIAGSVSCGVAPDNSLFFDAEAKRVADLRGFSAALRDHGRDYPFEGELIATSITCDVQPAVEGQELRVRQLTNLSWQPPSLAPLADEVLVAVFSAPFAHDEMIDEPIYGAVAVVDLPNGPSGDCDGNPLIGMLALSVAPQFVETAHDLDLSDEEAHDLMLENWSEDTESPGPRSGDFSPQFDSSSD